MRKACLAAACLLLALPAFAQAGGSKNPTSGQDRLFLTFAEEAAVVPHQWWEGQLEFRDGNPIDATIARGIVALKPWDNVEVGGRVGFGNTDSSNDLPDGSGATDLDVWGKFHFGAANAQTEFAAGALVTVPTGDDTAGLGDDSFDLSGFGSVRFHTDQLILSGVAGVRFNGDGQVFGGDDSPQGFDTQGKTSVLLSGGAIYPVSDVFSLTGEAYFESERIENADSDFRLGAGVNWRPWNRGILRGALIVGLSDGAPDAQVLASYAYTF
ncbi:MAG TPA: hypothetical protein VFV75_00415 [Candidatus Polarisedimenticolaceae bacterium]|nr:hypothetical protein [Candidatus Polarisedimenticolaceae bacterium]